MKLRVLRCPEQKDAEGKKPEGEAKKIYSCSESGPAVSLKKKQNYGLCSDLHFLVQKHFSRPPMLLYCSHPGARAETLTLLFPCRMKPRCLLSTVERLPTISEMHECCSGDGDGDCPSHNLEAYKESIKELSQPALYPLHGPLRGHRRWAERSGARAEVRTPSLFLNSSRTYASWTPVELSDVSVTLCNQANRLVGQSVFAGLA